MSIDKLVFKIKIKKWLGKLKLKRKNTKWPINEEEYRVDFLLDSINKDIGVFVEFGFAPDQCNCLNLAINRDFSGLFMDGSETKCNDAVSAYGRLGLLKRHPNS